MKRKDLEALGLEKETIDQIMNLHGETIEENKKQFEAKTGELTQIIADRDKFKTDYEKVNKDLSNLAKERDTYKSQYESTFGELNKYQQKEKVLGKGIAKDFQDFVSHEVSKLVSDDKDFDTALNEFVEANPQYKEGDKKKVSTSPDLSGNAAKSTNPNEAFNNALLEATGKK